MFTSDQIREFIQEIDNHVNNKKLPRDEVSKLLPLLEKEFCKIFQKDQSSEARNRYYTFKRGDSYYALMFLIIGSTTIRMLCINEFHDRINKHSGVNEIKWGETTPAHQFIYRYCNPEGVFAIERILFKEVI
jgi:hypothetical protein